jgi:DNA-binding transcriptional ArsR family regulator
MGTNADRPLRWLTPHARVLLWVALHPDSRVAEIATQVLLSPRTVMNVLNELEARGYVRRRVWGRRTLYSVNEQKPLRAEDNVMLADLMRILPRDHPWRRGAVGPRAAAAPVDRAARRS